VDHGAQMIRFCAIGWLLVPVDGLGGLVDAGYPGADGGAEVGGQVGVVVLEAVDGVVDADGDGFAARSVSSPNWRVRPPRPRA
jgi:hypothetical protein